MQALDGLYFSGSRQTRRDVCLTVSFWAPRSPESRGFMTEVTATRTSVNMRDQSNAAEWADSVDAEGLTGSLYIHTDGDTIFSNHPINLKM